MIRDLEDMIRRTLGETIDIKAGDTVYFDNNSKGTWEVLETVRKAYLTFKRD